MSLRLCLGSEGIYYPQKKKEYIILKIVDRFGFTGQSAYSTPMLHTTKLASKDCPTTDEGKAAMAQYPFRQAIAFISVLSIYSNEFANKIEPYIKRNK